MNVPLARDLTAQAQVATHEVELQVRQLLSLVATGNFVVDQAELQVLADCLREMGEGFKQIAVALVEEPAASSPPVERQPYSKPVLRHLGSVRKLTLTGTGTSPDFVGGRHRR